MNHRAPYGRNSKKHQVLAYIIEEPFPLKTYKRNGATNRRIARGTFPKPNKLSGRKKAIRKAFYLKDIHEWIKNPHMYRQAE